MQIFGLGQAIVQLAMTSSVSWFFLSELDIQVEGKRNGITDVEECILELGKDSALCETKWIVGVNKIGTRWTQILPPAVAYDTIKLMVSETFTLKLVNMSSKCYLHALN